MAAKQQQVVRLKKELKALLQDPIPNIVALPNPKNILEWHYVISGPKGTPYEGGVYHGKILFPTDYPFKPPSILMLTPSGRFTPNKRICLSMSDYHPETWNPLWSVGSILTGLLSFMLEDTPTAGSITSTLSQKRLFASKSMEFNVTNPIFRKIFPELCEGVTNSTSQATNENNNNNGTTTPQNNQANHDTSLLVYGILFFVVAAVVFALKNG